MLVTRPFPQFQRLSFYDQHKGKTFLIGEDDWMTGWLGGWMKTDLIYPNHQKPPGFLAQITAVSSIDGLKCMLRLHHSHWAFIRQETFLMLELYFVEM